MKSWWNLKKIKVQGSIKGQIKESQNQGSKCKRHVSSGTEINQIKGQF